MRGGQEASLGDATDSHHEADQSRTVIDAPP